MLQNPGGATKKIEGSRYKIRANLRDIGVKESPGTGRVYLPTYTTIVCYIKSRALPFSVLLKFKIKLHKFDLSIVTVQKTMEIPVKFLFMVAKK